MGKPCNTAVAALMFCASPILFAQQHHPVPHPGPETALIDKCDTTSLLPQGGTPFIATPLPGGKLVMYTMRVQMHTPEGNRLECSVRQYRILLPSLKNIDGLGEGPIPQIQITMETNDIVGAGDSLLLFGVARFQQNAYSAFLIDAQTPQGSQSPGTYFANVTVIAEPVAPGRNP